MHELEKILEEIELKKEKCLGVVKVEVDPMEIAIHREQYKGLRMAEEIIRKHMNDGWIPVEERLPEEKRANYEVTFINECGYEEHGFARWYDGEFHVPAVVIAWRNHLEQYRPEMSDNNDRESSFN